MIQSLNTLAKSINIFVNEVGFGDAEIPLRIALIHSEISEAFEAFMKDRFYDPNKIYSFEYLYALADNLFKESFEKHVKDTFEDEIADSIIRLLDLCAYAGIDIETHIDLKMRYNKTRGYKFGGKKF